MTEEGGAAEGTANQSRTDAAGQRRTTPDNAEIKAKKKIGAKSSLQTFLSNKSLEDESITP